MVQGSFMNKVVVGSNLVAVTQTSDIAPVSSKEFLDIQPTIECSFSLKRVRDIIRTYSRLKTNFVIFYSDTHCGSLS